MNIALWIVQGLLALAFGMAGFSKAFMPLDQLAVQMAWVADTPGWIVRFAGIAELFGAVGLILPAALRIRPGLTPMAAADLALVMVLAATLHLFRGEFAFMVPPAILFSLSMFVAWGRFRGRRIRPHGQTEPSPVAV
jgi:putative oxidoreductase